MSKAALRTAILVLSTLAVYMLLVQPVLSTVGTGVLYVYTDTWGGTLAPTNDKGHYLVIIGEKYYIRILGIECEFMEGDDVTVKISWTDTNGDPQTTFIYDVVVVEESDGVKYIDVEWTVPSNAKICLTSTVHYRKDTPEYVASGQMNGTPGHMHVIPTTFFGAIGALSALFAGLGAHKILKKNRQR